MNNFSPLTQLKRESAISEYYATLNIIELQKRLNHKRIQTTWKLLERNRKRK